MFVKKRTSEQNTEHCRSAAVRRKTHRNRTLRTWQCCCLHSAVDMPHCMQCCVLCHLHMCATLTCHYIALSLMYRSVIFRLYRKVLQKSPNGRTLMLSHSIIAGRQPQTAVRFHVRQKTHFRTKAWTSQVSSCSQKNAQKPNIANIAVLPPMFCCACHHFIDTCRASMLAMPLRHFSRL